MATLKDTGGSVKLRRVLEAIKAKTPEILREVGEAVAAQAASRAPTPEQEYETMMYGEGNPYGIPADTGSSDMPEGDDGDGRARFIKAPETYLQPWIAQDIHVNDMSVGVGWIEDLENISTYSWKNRGGSYMTDFGFYEAWELGGQFTVSPRFARKDGGPYPLRPSRAKQEPPLFEMSKTIPRTMMFGGVDLETEVEKIVIPAIRRVARGLS